MSLEKTRTLFLMSSVKFYQPFSNAFDFFDSFKNVNSACYFHVYLHMQILAHLYDSSTAKLLAVELYVLFTLVFAMNLGDLV